MDVPNKLTETKDYKNYRVTTEQGIYVIKLLKEKLNDEEIKKLKFSEKLLDKLSDNNLPVLIPNKYDGSILQCLEDKYYYIYNYFEGNILASKDIILEQCKIIGEVLGKTHLIDLQRIEKKTIPYLHIRWRKYLRLAIHKGSPISKCLSENITLLERATESCNNSLNSIPNVVTICYKNLNCHNVLWNNNDFRIINSEKVCYANPYIELLEVALSWSGIEDYKVNYNLFNNVIKEYFKEAIRPNIDWKVIYEINLIERLKIAEQNIKNALMIDCKSKDDQKYGEENVNKSIQNIVYYVSIKDEIISRLN